MRLMALDVGDRRIGIAVSESGVLARPHSILHRKSKKEDFARLGRLITELKIARLVVGLPHTLSGETPIGPQARRIKRYAEALAEALAKTIEISIVYFDESYSTVDAEAYLVSAGRRKKPGQHIDDVAAAVILQNYLNSSRNDGL